MTWHSYLLVYFGLGENLDIPYMYIHYKYHSFRLIIGLPLVAQHFDTLLDQKVKYSLLLTNSLVVAMEATIKIVSMIHSHFHHTYIATKINTM